MEHAFETAFKVAFPFVFIAGWVFTLHQLARMSGWANLAESYPGKKSFDGPKRYFQGAIIGEVPHNGTLIIGANRDGLHLHTVLPFRFGHPPIFIPWAAVASVHRKKRFMANFVVVAFEQHPEATLQLLERTADRLQEWSEGGFTVPV